MIQEKLIQLHQALVEYGRFVEAMVQQSINGLLRGNKKQLLAIIEQEESKANELNQVLQKFCITLISRYDPQEKDLENILQIVQIGHDLEAMGNHAVNIAMEALPWIEKPLMDPHNYLPRMANEVICMLDDAIRSFVQENRDLALSVGERNFMVHEFKDEILRDAVMIMNSGFSATDRVLNLLRACDDLERLADLCKQMSKEIACALENVPIRPPVFSLS